MTLTDGTATLTFSGEWISQLLTPQNVDITIAGNVRRQAADGRIQFAFKNVRLEEADCVILRTIFDNMAVSHLILTVDRNPITETTAVYNVVFSSALKLRQEASAGGGDIAYYLSWNMEEVLYV